MAGTCDGCNRHFDSSAVFVGHLAFNLGRARGGKTVTALHTCVFRKVTFVYDEGESDVEDDAAAQEDSDGEDDAASAFSMESDDISKSRSMSPDDNQVCFFVYIRLLFWCRKGASF